MFRCNTDRPFPEKCTVNLSFCPKCARKYWAGAPWRPIILLKSNKFNMAAVSVKRSAIDGVTCFHPPNWHFPLSGSHKTFHFSYMKFLCLLKFLFIKVSSILRKKIFRMARVGFDLGVSVLQCITLTPTPPRICCQWMVRFEDIYSNNPTIQYNTIQYNILYLTKVT